MLAKVTNAALKKATTKTRGGSEIGAAAGANFVKCFIKELSKLKPSQVLAIIEAAK